MPYIDKTRRPGLDQDYMKASEPGDLAYVFAKLFFKIWNKNPRWTTYHNLECLLIQPDRNEEYAQMIAKLSLSPHFCLTDVKVGARAALTELFHKCVRKYENGKCVANGEVYCE